MLSAQKNESSECGIWKKVLFVFSARHLRIEAMLLKRQFCEPSCRPKAPLCRHEAIPAAKAEWIASSAALASTAQLRHAVAWLAMTLTPPSTPEKDFLPNAAFARLILCADSIALIWCLARPGEKSRGGYCRRCARTISRQDFPINPNYGDIDGLNVIRRSPMIRQPIDLAIVIIPARRRARRARAMRCRRREERRDHLVGFARRAATAPRMQDAIVALAKGPECGFPARMRKDFYSQAQRVAAPSARPSTSSPMRRSWSRANGGSASSRKAAASALRSTTAQGARCCRELRHQRGNESDLGSGEFFEYMVQDPRPT